MSDNPRLNSWQKYHLADIAELQIGGTPARDIQSFWATNRLDGYLWVSIADLNQRIIYDTKEYITDLGVRSSNTKLVREGTLLISFKLTLGKAAIAGNNLFTNEAIVAIVPIKDIDGKFLYYVLPDTFKNAITDTAIKGVTLNKKSMKRLEVVLPSKCQQQKIAEILSTIDTAIEKTEELIKKYKQIKTGLMHDLFTRGVTPDGKLRPPREEAPELYKETPIGWIPKEWEAFHLIEKSIPGIPHLRTGPFGSSLKGEHWVDDGHPVITIGALGEGYFIESELLYVDDINAKRLFVFQLKEGDVVFSRVADVGRSAVITFAEDGWIMSSNLMRISLDSKKVIPKFIQQQIVFDERIKKQIRMKVNSGGREVANSTILNQLLFACPTPDEQKLIIHHIESLEKKINSELNNVDKMKMIKIGLMHDLLTGKKEVNVESEDEVNV